MKTIISLIAGLCLASFAAAQCSIANANYTQGNLFADPLNQWEYVDLFGNQGHDGFWFNAQEQITYVFTTLDEFGAGGSSTHDYQITILDANGNPAPGVHGISFHDDVNYGRQEADPLLIWSPMTSGSYTLLLTRWSGYSCHEIAPNDIARVAYRGFVTTTNRVSVWTGVDGVLASNGYNWMSLENGALSNSRPASLANNQCLMDANMTAWISGHEIVRELFLGPQQEIVLDNNAKVEALNDFHAPTHQGNFLGGIQAGVIRSADYLHPGSLVLKGSSSISMVAAGQFQDISFEAYTDVELTGNNSPFVNPNRFRSVGVHANIGIHTTTYIDGFINIANQQVKLALKSGCNLYLSDSTFFSHAAVYDPQGGVSFEGGRMFYENLKGPMRLIPILATMSDKAILGFDLKGQDQTTVEVSYQYNNTPNHSQAESPLVQISSKDYFSIHPDKSGLSARVLFYWHNNSGVGSAWQDLRLAGYNHALSKWEETGPNYGNNQKVDVYYVVLDNHFEFSLGSIALGPHSFRQDETVSLHESPLSVYPNPARNFIHIQPGFTLDTDTQVSIFDSQGKRVLQQPFSSVQPIDVRSLSPGNYTLTLRSKTTKSLHSKLVIH